MSNYIIDDGTQGLYQLPAGSFFFVRITHEREFTNPDQVAEFLKNHSAFLTGIDIKGHEWGGGLTCCVDAINTGGPVNFDAISQSSMTNSPPKTVKEKLTDKEIIERYNEIMKKKAEQTKHEDDNDYLHIEI